MVTLTSDPGSDVAISWVDRIPGGSVPFSVKETGDGLPRKSPRHNVLTCLFPSLMVCRLSHRHRRVPSGDSTRMIPQPTFTENGTDPGNFDVVCAEVKHPLPDLDPFTAG